MLRSQYEDESAKGWVSVQTKFNLAWGCVKSNDKIEVAEGVAILMGVSSFSVTLCRSPLHARARISPFGRELTELRSNRRS